MKFLTGDLIFTFPNNLRTKILAFLLTQTLENPIHVGIIIVEDDSVYEMSKLGGKATDIQTYLKQNICVVKRLKDEYRSKVDWKRLKALIRQICGQPYDFLAAVHLWLHRNFGIPLTPEDRLVFTCSGMVSYAFRTAGVDLVPDIADNLTSPLDIYFSDKLIHDPVYKSPYLEM